MMQWDLQGRVLRGRSQQRLVIQVDMNKDAADFYQRWVTLWLVLLRLLQWALPLLWHLATFASDVSQARARPTMVLRTLGNYLTTFALILALWFLSLLLGSLTHQLSMWLIKTLTNFFINVA